MKRVLPIVGGGLAGFTLSASFLGHLSTGQVIILCFLSAMAILSGFALVIADYVDARDSR